MTAAPTTRLVSVTPASTVRIERQLELWENQIMLSVPHLMAGMGGVGKSTFTCHIAAQVTRGTLDGDLKGTPANVMIINTEDSPAMVKARMLAAGADLDRVFIVSTKFCDEQGNLTETTPKLRQDVDQLEKLMLDHGVMLLVADPFATVIEGDTNTGTDVRATLDPMIRLAQNTGATVLIVSHFNKSAGAASNKISGSHAIRDAVRGAHVFAKDEEENVTVLTLDKNNYSGEVGKSQAFRLDTRSVPTDDGESIEVPVVVMLGETSTSVTDIINRAIGDGESADSDDAATWLYEYLVSVGGSANRKDVERAAKGEGFSEKVLRRAREKAKVETSRQGFPSTTVWTVHTPVMPSEAQSCPLPEVGATGHEWARLGEKRDNVTELFPTSPEAETPTQTAFELDVPTDHTERFCAVCNTSLAGRRPHAKTCSAACRKALFNQAKETTA